MLRHQCHGLAGVAAQHGLHHGLVFGIDIAHLRLALQVVQDADFAVALRLIYQLAVQAQQPGRAAASHQRVVKAAVAQLPQAGIGHGVRVMG